MRAAAGEIRSVERVTLTRIVVTRGAGTEASVFREVACLFDDEGQCVSEVDPCAEPSASRLPEDFREVIESVLRVSVDDAQWKRINSRFRPGESDA